MNHSLSRRTLLKSLALGTAAATVARRSRGADAAKLDVKDPAAIKLAYVEDAAKVDPKKFPSFVSGSNCENCLLLQGKPGSDYRPCTVFPGKLVAIKGWCSSWAAEM